MSEEWSLKGKENKTYIYREVKDEEIYYTPEDIETLREKLICDVQDLFSNSDWIQDFAEEVEDIINKRFGKDETDVSSEPDQRVGHGVEE